MRAFWAAAVVLTGLLLLDAATTTFGVLRYGTSAEVNSWVLNDGLLGLWVLKGLEAAFIIGITYLMGRRTRNLVILSFAGSAVVIWNLANLAGL